MSVISVIEASYCHGPEVIAACAAEGRFTLISSDDILRQAAQISGLSESKLRAALSGKTSVFNRFTHEKERSAAYLRLALATTLARDSLLIGGPTALLIPERISHVLRVCLVADHHYRQQQALAQGVSEKNLPQQLQQDDQQLAGWLHDLGKGSDPWHAGLYDIVIPMDKTSPAEAGRLILEKAGSEAVTRTAAAESALADFLLAAQVEVQLAQEGHNVRVDAYHGAITLIINKNVLMLARLEEELRGIVEKVSGVTKVTCRIGENFHQSDMYRRYDFEMPSKVLLVDDERDFVQTLSERLIMRDMGSAVAYDGESALNMIRDEEPEVMILDLKMPGIDGFEVLRQVKASNPDIEVIVLTGHGTEKDKDLCLKLGAFAFLQKPVDIQLLSQTLLQANEKVLASKKR